MGLFSLALGSDAKTFGASIRAVGRDETAAVQALLRQVRADVVLEVPATFDARDAGSRLCMLVLSLRDPRPPPDDEGSAVEWLAQHDEAAFTRWPDARSPAARFLTPGVSPARWRDTLLDWASQGDQLALRSHLVEDPDLLADPDRLVAARAEALGRALREAHSAMAEPDHADRPALTVELP